jgi:hypothetical protein
MNSADAHHSDFLKTHAGALGKFGICKVNKLGALSVEWVSLPSFYHTQDFSRLFENCPAYTPGFEFGDAVPGLLKRLEFLDNIDRMIDRVKVIRATIEAEQAKQGIRPPWAGFLCDVDHIDIRTWVPMNSNSDFERFLKASRNEKLLPGLIRVSLERATPLGIPWLLGR